MELMDGERGPAGLIPGAPVPVLLGEGVRGTAAPVEDACMELVVPLEVGGSIGCEEEDAAAPLVGVGGREGLDS